MATLTLKAIRKEIDKALAERFGPLPAKTPAVKPSPTPTGGNPIAAHHDAIPALIQTDTSMKLLPGEWLVVNLQANGAELITDIDYWRVRLNTGCGPQGELDGQPAAHRGFETADTPAERERLARATSSSFAFDVAWVSGNWQLDMSKPLVKAAGLTPIAAHPIVHIVRAVSWDALDEWVRWTAQGRQ